MSVGRWTHVTISSRTGRGITIKQTIFLHNRTRTRKPLSSIRQSHIFTPRLHGNYNSTHSSIETPQGLSNMGADKTAGKTSLGAKEFPDTNQTTKDRLQTRIGAMPTMPPTTHTVDPASPQDQLTVDFNNLSVGTDSKGKSKDPGVKLTSASEGSGSIYVPPQRRGIPSKEPEASNPDLETDVPPKRHSLRSHGEGMAIPRRAFSCRLLHAACLHCLS